MVYSPILSFHSPFSLSLFPPGFPLHYDDTHGWGYLRPEEGAVVHTGADEVVDSLLQQEEEVDTEVGNDKGFPFK